MQSTVQAKLFEWYNAIVLRQTKREVHCTESGIQESGAKEEEGSRDAEENVWLYLNVINYNYMVAGIIIVGFMLFVCGCVVGLYKLDS